MNKFKDSAIVRWWHGLPNSISSDDLLSMQSDIWGNPVTDELSIVNKTMWKTIYDFQTWHDDNWLNRKAIPTFIYQLRVAKVDEDKLHTYQAWLDHYFKTGELTGY